MAGDAVVGALRVIFGMDTAQLEDGVKKATSELQGFQKTFLKIGAALGVGLGVEAIISSVKTTINSLEELNKASQKVGVPVEELSALKFAAGLADVEMEALSSSLVKLAKNMSEVAKGSAGPAADAFKALGIEVKNADGSLRSQTDVIGDLADAFQGFKDSAEKTAIAVAIFGKAGALMIPLLNQGRIGLKQSADEAERFGLIVDGQLADAAERFNDNLKRLKGASEGLTISLIQGMLPSLINLTEEMLDAKEKGEGLVAVGEKIGRVFETVAFVIRANIVFFTEIGIRVAAFAKAISEVSNLEPGKALQTLAAASEQSAKNFENFGKVWDAFWDGDPAAEAERLAAEVLNLNRGLEGTPPIVRDATKSLENFIQSSGDNINQMRAQIATFGKTEGAVAKLKFELQALAKTQKEPADPAQLLAIKGMANEVELLTNRLDALQKNKAIQEAIRGLGLQAREAAGEFTGRLAPGFLQAAQSLKIIKEDGSNLAAVLSLTDEKARKLNDAMFRLAGFKLAAEFLTPWEQFDLKMKEINAEIARTPEKMEVLRQAGTRAAAEMASAYGRMAQAIVDPVASAFKDLASINKKYAGAAKAAAIGQAIVNTYVAATKALADPFLPFPLNYAAAAAVTAAGLAQVAKISATEFAQGGTFKVGGVGGIDSQTIAMNLTPGEMVDVRKPGQQTTPTEVTVNMRGRDLISRDMVRDLFAALNEGTRDGYRLKLAEA